jgi:hypothetical protein
LQNGRQVNLHTVRDPFGAACIGAMVFDAGKSGQHPHQIKLEQARRPLRRCFALWNTLPEQIQTDNQTGLAAARQSNDFPTTLTLWLIGLGIEHVFIRPARPTDNAEVERCHRTITDDAITGNQDLSQEQLQQVLDLSVHELNFELPSQAHGCDGKPPVEAHPEVLHPTHPFRPEWELSSFDLQRVYDFGSVRLAKLAVSTWVAFDTVSGRAMLANEWSFVLNLPSANLRSMTNKRSSAVTRLSPYPSKN